MKKTSRRLLDTGLVLAGVAILAVLLVAPPGTTPRLPDDPLHHPLAESARQKNRKVAESSCLGCHNTSEKPFPKNHPKGERCLFCHRLPPLP